MHTDYVEIQIRREASVEAHFFPTKMRALVEFRIIKEAEIDWFLDFVYVVAGEQDPRNMRLHQRKRADRMIE
jgi:hypothetical protein